MTEKERLCWNWTLKDLQGGAETLQQTEDPEFLWLFCHKQKNKGSLRRRISTSNVTRVISVAVWCVKDPQFHEALLRRLDLQNVSSAADFTSLTVFRRHRWLKLVSGGKSQQDSWDFHNFICVNFFVFVQISLVCSEILTLICSQTKRSSRRRKLRSRFRKVEEESSSECLKWLLRFSFYWTSQIKPASFLINVIRFAKIDVWVDCLYNSYVLLKLIDFFSD